MYLLFLVWVMLSFVLMVFFHLFSFFFFFNDTATTEIYTLSLHDALPISASARYSQLDDDIRNDLTRMPRSEEHTSELQSRQYLVCRLLLEKKKNTKTIINMAKQKKNNKKTKENNNSK